MGETFGQAVSGSSWGIVGNEEKNHHYRGIEDGPEMAVTYGRDVSVLGAADCG